MDDVIERLKRLDAMPDELPPVDVTSWVLSDIRARRGPESASVRNALLAVLATAGSSAALTATYMAYEVWSAFQDPLGQFLNSWSLVLQ